MGQANLCTQNPILFFQMSVMDPHVWAIRGIIGCLFGYTLAGSKNCKWIQYLTQNSDMECEHPKPCLKHHVKCLPYHNFFPVIIVKVNFQYFQCVKALFTCFCLMFEWSKCQLAYSEHKKPRALEFKSVFIPVSTLKKVILVKWHFW